MTKNPLRYLGPVDPAPTDQTIEDPSPQDLTIGTEGYVEETLLLNVTQATVNADIAAAFTDPVSVNNQGVQSSTGSTGETSTYATQAYVNSQMALLATVNDVKNAQSGMIPISWIGAPTSGSVGEADGGSLDPVYGTVTSEGTSIYGVAGLVQTSTGALMIPDGLLTNDQTHQEYPQNYFQAPDYNTTTMVASVDPETVYSFSVTLPDTYPVYNLMVFGWAEAAVSENYLYPIVKVRLGSQTGTVIASGAGTPYTYTAGLFSSYVGDPDVTGATNGYLQIQPWTNTMYLVWIGAGGGAGAGVDGSDGAGGTVQYATLGQGQSYEIPLERIIRYSLGGGGKGSKFTDVNLLDGLVSLPWLTQPTQGGSTNIFLGNTTLPMAAGGKSNVPDILGVVPPRGEVNIPNAAQPPGPAPTFPNTPPQMAGGTMGNSPGGGGAAGSSQPILQGAGYGLNGGNGAPGGLYTFEVPVDSLVHNPVPIAPLGTDSLPASATLAAGSTVEIYVTLESRGPVDSIGSIGSTGATGEGGAVGSAGYLDPTDKDVEVLPPATRINASLWAMPVPVGEST